MGAYVHLWVLEGLLRKAVPALNEVLYFGRDGLAIVAIFVAVVSGRLGRAQTPGVILGFLVLLWSCISAMLGAESIGVWLVGVRSYIAPILFVFLYSICGTDGHRRKIHMAVLFYLPVEAMVVIAQVTSPATSFWNLQTSGEEAHFLNDGIARASGTFSAPAGLFGFILLAVAIAFASVASSVGRERLIAWLGIISAFGIGSLSGSRGTVAVLAVLICGFLVWVALNGTLQRFVLIGFIALTAIGLMHFISVAFPEVLDAFGSRIEDASQHEDTFARIAFTIWGFLDGLNSFFGAGAGHNSQAGIAVGSQGPWIENESLRWVSELGAFGLLLALVRIFCAVMLLIGCFLRATVISPQRFMIALGLAVVLFQGTITQNPSSQGAFSIMLALFFASGGRIGDTDAGVTRPVQPVFRAQKWVRKPT